MLKLEHISSGYPNKQVLFDVSFEVERGSFTLLVGPNGSGKSTLFKTIFGIIKPLKQVGQYEPHIWFNGEDIIQQPSFSFAQKGIVYVPQQDNYFPNLDVETSIRISGANLLKARDFPGRINEVYSIFPELKKKRHQNLMFLSGGERQMAILAMALLHRPKLMLIDEPTLNLSPTHRKLILEKLSELNKKEKVTILMVEHKVNESLLYVDHLIGIKDGEVFGVYDTKESFRIEILKDLLI